VVSLGRVLIVTGALLLLAGLALTVRLPGDIVYRRGNFTFYFPLMTSILLSVIVSLLLWLLRR
jgi:Protein of unknown function (DUF2905)